MTEPIELSIIIVNYKQKGLLRQCLRGIFDDPLPFRSEVIVVDNHSGDGSVEMIREEFSDAVKLIASPHNHGFAAGINLGMAQSVGAYLLILNADIVVFQHAIAEVMNYLKRRPQVGIAVPRLLNPDGTTQSCCYRFHSPLIPIYRRTLLGRLPWAHRALQRFLMTDWDHNDSRAIGWALGGCMVIPRTVIDRVGMFDERFFLYFEDVDMCRRVWTAGYEVHYVHTSSMVHYHHRMSAANGGGLGTLFAYPTRVHIRSWIKYLLKYLGQPKPPHSV